MVRVNLKGVHSVTRTLASGRIVTYHYAWRGGPPIHAEPGSPEFQQAFIDAHKNPPAKQRKIIATLSDLADEYLNSVEFDANGDDTRRAYKSSLEDAKKHRIGKLPLRALEVKRVRSHFKLWRDEMKEKPRTADMHISALSALLSWSEDFGYIDANHAKGIGRLAKSNTRADIVWDDQLRLIPLMRKDIKAVHLFALATGQRQGDILSLPKQLPGNEFIELVQSKTGVRVFIYRTRTVNEILEMAGDHDAITHFATSRGTPWTSSGFRASTRRERKRVGIEGVTFHDLRGTFENRAWEAPCTEAECYAVTGRALKSSQSANAYFARSRKLSRAAMTKIESTFWEHGCKTLCKMLNSDTTVVAINR